MTHTTVSCSRHSLRLTNSSTRPRKARFARDRVGLTQVLGVTMSSHIKLFSFAICLLVVAPERAQSQKQLQPDPELGYVIFHIEVDSKRQPTWLALNRGRLNDHIANNAAIVALPPGRYTFDHIDFRENPRKSPGSYALGGAYEFSVVAGKVLLFGALRIEGILPVSVNSRSYRGPDMQFIDDTELLRKACSKAPLVLANFPLYGPDANLIEDPCGEIDDA